MPSVPRESKSTWITRLGARPVVHRAIRLLRVRQLAARVLAFVPLRVKLKRTTYRVRFLESLLIADEIFKREVYRAAFEGRTIRTFVDVGSNVGYFPLYAVEHTGRKDLLGLVIDGNEEMASESRWHVEKAELPRTRVIHGLVGHPAGVSEATFYVNPSNIASSAQPKLNPRLPSKGESHPVTVPVVDLLAQWRKLAGDARIDLLKVDVEGFECELLRNCAEVLAITDRIVIEWHKWVTTREEIGALLSTHGFELRCVTSEDEDAGVAVYDRPHSDA